MSGTGISLHCLRTGNESLEADVFERSVEHICYLLQLSQLSTLRDAIHAFVTEYSNQYEIESGHGDQKIRCCIFKV